MAFMKNLGKALGAFGGAPPAAMGMGAGSMSAAARHPKWAALAGAANTALNGAPPMNPPMNPGINTGPSAASTIGMGMKPPMPMNGPPMGHQMQLPQPIPMGQPQIVQPPNIPDFTNAPPPVNPGRLGMLGLYGGNNDPRRRY